MSDTLNKEEIKELLQDDANTAAEKNGSYEGYDLTKNDSTAFNKLSSLDLINDSFIRNAKNSLNEILKTNVEISILEKSIEKCNVYMSKLQAPCSIDYVKINPVKLHGLFVLNSDLVYSFVDRYFGGGIKANNKSINKEMTQIELKIIRLILDRLFLDVKDAWQRICDLQIEYQESETNPLLMKCATKTDLLVAIKFKVDMGERGGEFHICYPHAMLLQYKEVLESGNRKEISDENWLKKIKEELMDVELEAFCVLAQRKISLKEVRAFKRDDIVNIELPEEIILKINNINLFKATFGTFEGKYAVKITEKILGQKRS